MILDRPSVYRYPQLAKDPLLTGANSANPSNRLWAKVVDVLFVYLVSLAFGMLLQAAHFIAPLLLFSFMEQWGRGQSPGKWLLGLHTIEAPKGTPVSILSAFIRNIPVILLIWGIFCSGFLGWLIFTIAALVAGFESYFIYTLKTGVRVGDIVSNTRVFDYKDEHTKFIEQFLKDEKRI